MRRITLTLALAVLCGCGASTPTSGQAGSPAASSVAITCTPSGAASSSWLVPASASATSPAIVSATVAGDTMKLTFAIGTPQFRVEPVSSSHFTQDPSGRAVDLAGSAGVKVVLSGFRGDVTNYAGQTSITSSGPLLLQASELGDFEGVVTFAAGTSKPACANVSTTGSTLTFQFIPAP